MFKHIEVALNERAVVFKNGLPQRTLGPGRHTIWSYGVTVARYKVDELVFDAPAEVRAVLPTDWYEEVEIASDQRGVLYRDGVPQEFLRPGKRRYWKVDPSVTLVVYSVNEPMPELSDELFCVLPCDEYVSVVVQAHEKALCYVQGRLTETLEPGHHAFWSHAGARVEIRSVDMRQVELPIVGQELMTRDKVTLRLSLSVEYAIEDPALALHRVAKVRDAVYLLVQLAARDYLSGVTLDELLGGRDEMTRYLHGQVAPAATAFGVRIERVGVKDVVLPGEMKTLLNRVIEAEKEAAANVILRREETAATRSLANTARVMADNPVLLRLKELESLKDIAERIGELRLVVGSNGFEQLLPTALLTERSNGGR